MQTSRDMTNRRIGFKLLSESCLLSCAGHRAGTTFLCMLEKADHFSTALGSAASPYHFPKMYSQPSETNYDTEHKAKNHKEVYENNLSIRRLKIQVYFPIFCCNYTFRIMQFEYKQDTKNTREQCTLR